MGKVTEVKPKDMSSNSALVLPNSVTLGKSFLSSLTGKKVMFTLPASQCGKVSPNDWHLKSSTDHGILAFSWICIFIGMRICPSKSFY